LHQGELRYKVKLDSGPFILFDSLILLNQIKTNPNFITRTLGISANSPFSESAYRSISQKINRISHLSLIRPPDVSFQDARAWTYLDIEEGSTGSFQGILGLLPNQGTGQGVLITGNLDLSLLNLFRSGKELNFSWAQFAEQSQRLEASYRHPFIAGTSIHLNTSFKLFKQDTSFLNRETALSGSFYVSPQVEMGFGYKQQNATVLTSQIAIVSDRNWLDFNQDWYFWQIRKGNNRIVKSGNMSTYASDLAIGRRRVKRNSQFPLDFYDTVQFKTTNFKWEAQVQIQRNIGKQSYLFGSLSMAHLSSSSSANQLYRVGGLQTFRGFNEQFFYTPTYIISQLEGRLFFEEQSYVFVFYDQGFLKNRTWSNPLGLGGGFSLLTNSGLFSFAMAVGRSEAIPFELANMKIHFGYLSRF
jgi:hemolysin activation/secretion protein